MFRKAKIDSEEGHLRKARHAGLGTTDPVECYKIGDTGPGGGIIFSIPSIGNNTTTNTYYEVAPVDVSINQAQTSYLQMHPSCKETLASGAEFGAYTYSLPPAFINSSMLMGSGKNNTDTLDAYPILIGTHPTIVAHDIAATLCKNYVGPNGDTDWFLPSADEAVDLVTNIGSGSYFANIANLQTGLNNPASGFYWTSSVPPGSTSNTKAVIFEHSSSSTTLLYLDRCVTASVRPIRRFICTPDLLLDPIISDPVLIPLGAEPLEYNYRYLPGGLGMGSIYWNENNGPAIHIIGDPSYEFKVWIGKEDAVGNPPYTGFQLNTYKYNVVPIGWLPNGQPIWPHMVQTYKFSVWDVNENFRGSWSYTVAPWREQHLCAAGQLCHDPVILHSPIHLAGPDPILDMTDPTKFPLVPQCLGCDTGPYPAGNLPPPATGQPGYCVTNTNPNACGEHPLYQHHGHRVSLAYVKVEQHYMLQNPYADTVNLTNYAGTGRDLRFVGTNVEWDNNLKDFLYHCTECNPTFPVWRCIPWLKEVPPPSSLVTGIDPYCKYTQGMPCINLFTGGGIDKISNKENEIFNECK